MRLIQISDTFMLDVDDIREVWLKPADGDEEAEVTIRFKSGRSPDTLCHDDLAITVWHRLRDLCDKPAVAKP